MDQDPHVSKVNSVELSAKKKKQQYTAGKDRGHGQESEMYLAAAARRRAPAAGRSSSSLLYGRGTIRWSPALYL
jgi:hypothetical protein